MSPARSRPAGLWITFEGIEGCGKSSQLARLARRLRERGLRVVATREPGGTPLGRRLRALLLRASAAPLDPAAELLLYVADRAQHLSEVVRPALGQARTVVLSDRFLDATVAYQGHARGLGAERVLELHRRPPLDLRPRRTLLLDLDPRVALERARARNRSRGVERSAGRFEAEALAFHRRVRAGYLSIAAAEPRRVRVVDARGARDEVFRRVWAAVEDLVPPARGVR